MKTWLMAIALALMACHEVGGDCDYETADIEARVIAIDAAEAGWDACPRPPTRRLEMIDRATGEEVLPYGRRIALMETDAVLEQYGLIADSTHPMRLMRITDGTCSPEIYEFLELNVDVEQITCVADLME